MGVRRYEDLACWQLATDLKRLVYEFSAASPARRDLKFCDQIRTTARSAPSNIAEGFGRFNSKEFARFLGIARASLMETHNHLLDARDLGYLEAQRAAEA